MKRAVLLDVDGTLVDSNDLHADAWRLALEAFGFQVPFERIRPLIGMGGDKLLPILTGLPPDSALGTELKQQRRRVFREEYAPEARALPGARALIEKLLDAGHRPIIATSAERDELELLLTRANLSDLLPTRITADDADRSKPDPDIVEAALSMSGVSAGEALMIGDTPYDLRAAVRVHVGFVGVRSGGYDDHALRGALAIYTDAQELCERFGESPFRRD